VVPVELAVLDMAGTTVRDDDLVTSAFERALEAVGVGPDAPGADGRLAQVRAMMGRSKIEVFTAMLGDADRARRATTAFEAAVREAVEGGEVVAIDGAESAFVELRASGIRVCLTTGFSAETQALIIDRLGWAELIDLQLAPGPGVRGRPHPDLILQALMQLGLDDVRAVATAGDTVNDLLSGWRAGAGIVAGVLTGAHDRTALEAAPHTHILDSIADLPPIVTRRPA
jgi:phosphoglycolate phosphatase